MSGRNVKDPADVVDFSWSWAAELGAGETITLATVTLPDQAEDATPLLEKVDNDPTVDGALVTIWLRGGVDGADYAVVCRITTSEDRVFEHTRMIRVRDRVAW